jgi:ribosome-binding factor A
MPSTRQRRVQELLVQQVAEIVRGELRDPGIGFITITDAEVTPDLRHAKVFFSVLGDKTQQEESGRALNRAAGYVRGEFGRRAQMRFVPEIRFVFDPSTERGMRISQLLEQAKQEERDAGGPAGAGGGGDTEGG